MPNKNILLIEPGYRNKYPPLGLMKIAQYHGPNGKKDNVRFIKGEDKSVLGAAWDRIYVTSLFSFEWDRIARSIDFALEVAGGHSNKVFVGGIAASLMHDRFEAEPKWRGIRFIKGLLDSSPAESLQLDGFEGELYSSDTQGEPIENLTPDYSILDQVEYEYPVHDAYFVYASRGCVRKCKFCGVPTLEGDLKDTYSVSKIVKSIEEQYGPKKDLVFMDNNVVASPNFRNIIDEIVDLGFGKDAPRLKRGRSSVQRRVDFNQGVDARILSKDPMYLEQLSRICLSPLRIAFDHLGLKKPYEASIRMAANVGLTNLSNYMLYNFHDDPSDLYERMKMNVVLNEELDIRIFSFPMRYQPTDLPHRGHVGEKWNSYYLRSMQIILQATHGIVSGAPDFFRKAFGDTKEEFNTLLLRPHHYIFNRFWYEQFDGRGEFDQYLTDMKRLSQSDQEDLIEFLSTTDSKRYIEDAGALKSNNVRAVIPYYVPLAKEDERKIWDAQKAKRTALKDQYHLPEDEVVEDAGLNDDGLEEDAA